MSKRWRGIGNTSVVTNVGGDPVSSLGRFQTRSGHVCVLCGFVPTTKNKYRELQDHLVRIHFRDAIKASLPTRRPYLCPEKACSVEGKDWQALMRHYTGKHGILDAYLKEALTNNGNVTVNHGETTIATAALDHETLFIQDHGHLIPQEVIDPHQQHHHHHHHHQEQHHQHEQVEVVTSFELPAMMTTLEDTTQFHAELESDSSHHHHHHTQDHHHHHHQQQQQQVQIHCEDLNQITEVTTEEIAKTEELGEKKSSITSSSIMSPTESLNGDTSIHSSSSSNGGGNGGSNNSSTTTTTNNNGNNNDNELAAQINTVSSTIQFPTTIPLMLGATATKRAKTDPDILINNGEDAENYAFVDLKYFLAAPSKVMALPYKIILPQVEEEIRACEDRFVQVESPKSCSVQVQTDPWFPSANPITQTSYSSVQTQTSLQEQTTTTSSISTTSTSTSSSSLPTTTTTSSSMTTTNNTTVATTTNNNNNPTIGNNNNNNIDDSKELDFTMF